MEINWNITDEFASIPSRLCFWFKMTFNVCLRLWSEILQILDVRGAVVAFNVIVKRNQLLFAFNEKIKETIEGARLQSKISHLNRKWRNWKVILENIKFRAKCCRLCRLLNTLFINSFHAFAEYWNSVSIEYCIPLCGLLLRMRQTHNSIRLLKWNNQIKSVSLFANNILCIFLHRLVNLAFAGSIGMTLVILACALPQYK